MDLSINFRINRGNKMNCYEHTIIIKQDCPQDQIKLLIDKYKNLINNNLGKIVKTEDWGLKNFSQPIKNNKKGFYFHIKFEGDGNTIIKLEQAENIDQMIIRFLTVKVKKHDLDKEYFDKKTT